MPAGMEELARAAAALPSGITLSATGTPRSDAGVSIATPSDPAGDPTEAARDAAKPDETIAPPATQIARHIAAGTFAVDAHSLGAIAGHHPPVPAAVTKAVPDTVMATEEPTPADAEPVAETAAGKTPTREVEPPETETKKPDATTTRASTTKSATTSKRAKPATPAAKKKPVAASGSSSPSIKMRARKGDSR